MAGRPFAADDRGLGLAIVGFIAALVIAALLFTLLDPAADQLFDMASSQTSATEAQDAIDRREQIWNGLLFFFIVLAGLFLIARSIVESRRPG